MPYSVFHHRCLSVIFLSVTNRMNGVLNSAEPAPNVGNKHSEFLKSVHTIIRVHVKAKSAHWSSSLSTIRLYCTSVHAKSQIRRPVQSNDELETLYGKTDGSQFETVRLLEPHICEGQLILMMV